MSALRSFAPWIAFTAVIGHRRLASRCRARRCASRSPAPSPAASQDAEPDDLANATTVFFAALTIVSVANPNSGLQQYVPALAPAALGIGAGLSILRGRPFTIPFAKRSTPPELWDQPRFYAANVTISMIWTVSFALTAAVLRHRSRDRGAPGWFGDRDRDPRLRRAHALHRLLPPTPPRPLRRPGHRVNAGRQLDDHQHAPPTRHSTRRQLPARHR